MTHELDPKGLEAAMKAWFDTPGIDVNARWRVGQAIAAYLAAIEPEGDQWRPISEDIPRNVVLHVRRPLIDGDMAHELWTVSSDGIAERAGIVPTSRGFLAFAHSPGANRLSNLVASRAEWLHIRR